MERKRPPPHHQRNLSIYSICARHSEFLLLLLFPQSFSTDNALRWIYVIFLREWQKRNNIDNKCYCWKERKTRRNNIRHTFENVIDDFLRNSRSFFLPFVCNLRAEKRRKEKREAQKIGNNSNFSKVFLFQKEWNGKRQRKALRHYIYRTEETKRKHNEH